jgi:hypothetical protein
MAATAATRPRSRPKTAGAPGRGSPGTPATASKLAADTTPEGRAAVLASSAASKKRATGSKSSGGRHAKQPASRAGRAHQKALSGAREGAAGGAKKASAGLRRTLVTSNRGLLAEYLICMAILGAGTMVPTPAGRPQEGVPHLMVKGSALSLLFFILSLTAATGDKARRVVTGLGAVVTVGYLVTSADAYNILHWITGFYSKPGTAGAGVTAAVAQGNDLIAYTPAKPYPWVVQTSLPQASGPPGTTTGGSGELVA